MNQSPVSSAHGIGVGDLLDEVIRVLPDEEDEFEEDEIKVSIIGRPNVGKSSLTMQSLVKTVLLFLILKEQQEMLLIQHLKKMVISIESMMYSRHA